MIEKTATAVQGYVKALRMLGYRDTSIGKIADALRLSDQDVLDAFDGFKIVGAAINDRCSISHIRTRTVFTKVVKLTAKGGR